MDILLFTERLRCRRLCVIDSVGQLFALIHGGISAIAGNELGMCALLGDGTLV